MRKTASTCCFHNLRSRVACVHTWRPYTEGNTAMQGVLTGLGAQGLIGKIFDQHDTLEYHGRFTTLRPWLKQTPPAESAPAKTK